ncbi:hypothetical protein PENTCL1PPCAC_23845, partial [Pristionchus entomophagus]
SPPRKKQKKEEVAKLPIGVSHSGVIRFVVDKISTLDNNDRLSPEVEVGGVHWRARVRKFPRDGRDRLDVGLECTMDQLAQWSIEANCSFILVHSDRSKNIENPMNPETFDQVHKLFGISIMIWEELIDEEKGFVKDDKITIELQIESMCMKGVRIPTYVDFSDPNDPINDVALIINGEKIYASKPILAAHSRVFKAMFYGNFNEKNKKEIELKDVNREEFLEILHAIYPPYKKITDVSAEYLIKLGDQFQIESLTDRAERFLSSQCTFLSNMEKLRISDQYRLFGLQEHCLSALNTSQDFKDVKESPIYDNLSDATKVALFEQHLKIV